MHTHTHTHTHAHKHTHAHALENSFFVTTTFQGLWVISFQTSKTTCGILWSD